jgi:hypothetical protein
VVRVHVPGGRVNGNLRDRDVDEPRRRGLLCHDHRFVDGDGVPLINRGYVSPMAVAMTAIGADDPNLAFEWSPATPCRSRGDKAATDDGLAVARQVYAMNAG